MLYKKTIYLFFAVCLFCLILSGCGDHQVISSKSSGNPEYEKLKIVIEGEIAQPKAVTVAEMRQLPQQEMDCSLQQSTGTVEKFAAAGPTLKDVLAHVGIDVKAFKGIGFVGKDGYYCLVTPEIIEKRNIILALAIDGKSELEKNMSPARLCVYEEFGPYWVRMVDKIILYKEIPKKDISSVWIFNNLAEGIEPYPYEYYGSKDNAIDLAQILSRFDNVNSKAFFTMKSSDGFTKSEALNMISKSYYIKVAGEGAPMNISPSIKLGMNLKHIAWFSTNADAAVFPKEMMDLIGGKEINGIKGIALGEMIEEVQVRGIEEKQFEVMGVNGESVKLSGKDLSKGLLVIKEDGTYPVVWQNGTEFKPVSNLRCIRSVQ